ncbi:MAG TPA: hypothetical protein VH370_19945 [Humisphaera sp.]|jgi:hypothetical protein|nr:hypothetical protein [Humisphaera sp.]
MTGRIGLSQDQIIVAHAIYEQSPASERNGKSKGPLGPRSIKWSLFKTVDYASFGGVVAIDWLKLAE